MFKQVETSMPKNLWTREELILAFNLYLKLPFGKMHKHNPEIIDLANLLDRTPSSIGMRLGNFASCDPGLQARGIGGLKGGMNQVQPIWDEFYSNQEELVFKSEEILAERQKTTIAKKYADILLDIKDLEGKSAMRQVQARVNQSVFRTMVLNNYYSKCCITGLSIPALLVASHIVPWSKNEKERLNPRNGLCLNALHDRAFDKGYMTITSDFKVCLSKAFMDFESEMAVQAYFKAFDNIKIQIPDKFIPSKLFLEYHYEHVFIK
ncbi:MAG: HNH endonuclease [Sphingobacteriaceae bacterium]|nr:HNH endonuclease [Sphingobacteriaceae bacterium]